MVTKTKVRYPVARDAVCAPIPEAVTNLGEFPADRILGTVIAGPLGLVTLTGAGRSLIDDATVADMLATLGLGSAPEWLKVASHSYVDFSIAGPSNQIILGAGVSLAARQSASAVVVKVTTQFAGPGLGSAAIDVGKTGTDNWIIGGVDGLAVPGNTVFDYASGLWISNWGAGTGLKTTLTCDINLNTLSAGAFDVWLVRSQIPA